MESKSIYNGAPPDWIDSVEGNTSPDRSEESESKPQPETQKDVETKQDSSELGKEENKQDIPVQKNTESKETPSTDVKENGTDRAQKERDSKKENKSGGKKTDSDKKKNNKKIKSEQKKKSLEKERLKKLETEYRNKDRNHKESNKEIHDDIYDEEIQGNKTDLMIVGGIGAVVIIAIIFIIVNFSDVAYRKTGALINEGNYATAYRNIEDFYNRGKNVDKLVYQFSEKCMRDRKYANAVEPIQYLSEGAVKNPEFFDQLVTELVQHGRIELADKVISFMQNRGGTLQQLALKLRNQYEELA